MGYAIIAVGGKQYRVQEGERLLVDRLRSGEGETFAPRVLLVGGNGRADLSPAATVTARVVRHVLGDKVRIGKYKRRTGYKRHTGFRAHLTQIEIESIGGGGRGAASAGVARAETAALAETPARAAHPPKGYETMSIAEIKEHVPGWRRPNIEAALEHERANANRKGALAALESALKERDGA